MTPNQLSFSPGCVISRSAGSLPDMHKHILNKAELFFSFSAAVCVGCESVRASWEAWILTRRHERPSCAATGH